MSVVLSCVVFCCIVLCCIVLRCVSGENFLIKQIYSDLFCKFKTHVFGPLIVFAVVIVAS